MYSKGEVIGYVWQYSKYYGNMLGYCEQVSQDENSRYGHISLLTLFNLSEVIFKSVVGNYDDEFKKIIQELKDRNIINEIEHDFLNNEQTGIRKLRNLLAHANLSKYNIIFREDTEEIMYPLTENETCEQLYEVLSPLLFNLILKVLQVNFIIPIEVNIDNNIQEMPIQIKEISTEKLLEYKGIDFSELEGWEEMLEVDKYRLAENASDVNILTEIFKQLLVEK